MHSKAIVEIHINEDMARAAPVWPPPTSADVLWIKAKQNHLFNLGI
jgi:hypothetical protein